MPVDEILSKLKMHGWDSIGLEDEHWYKVREYLRASPRGGVRVFQLPCVLFDNVPAGR